MIFLCLFYFKLKVYMFFKYKFIMNKDIYCYNLAE